MAAPDVARRYADGLAAEKAAALGSVARSWSRMGPDFDSSWLLVGPLVLEAVSGAQVQLAGMADRYVESVAPLTVSRLREPDYSPDLNAWAGIAGDGRAVSTLSYGAVITARTAVGAGASVDEALAAGGRWLSTAMGTALSDTHRGVEQIGMRSRHVGMYVRMTAGRTTCGRCVILAGRKYRSAEAFDRHPGCDCLHIPASENVAGDLSTDPHPYLDSLSKEELAKVLGSKANAQAWRDGADVNQLVNAYRRKGAVQKAHGLSYTSEGTTKRGWANAAMAARHGAGASAQRLMPSAIYEIATGPVDAARLLRTYGWIL